MPNKKLLVIGLTWPEPATTAAGVRMLQLINIFKDYEYQITFVSGASPSQHSYEFNSETISTQQIELNNSSFNTFIEQLDPGIVLFDRFITEEHYGWRVAQCCPNAIRILDTEDLHCLRDARKKAIENGTSHVHELMRSTLAKREIASIYRCDISLIISAFEYELLINRFKICKSLIFYLPFVLNTSGLTNLNKHPSFENRSHFMSIGNFNHAPNKKAVEFIHNEIWPELSKLLPKAEMHIYGAYPPISIKKLHSPKNRFFIKGWIENLEDAYINYRVCLAPLEFGAGLKGKLLESMKYGTPNVTTSIGSEGMGDSKNWNGFISNKPADCIKNAYLLYTDKPCWNEMQQNGFELLKASFDEKYYKDAFLKNLLELKNSIEEHRIKNFIGSMLVQNTTNASKYFSKWIELKNEKNQ